MFMQTYDNFYVLNDRWRNQVLWQSSTHFVWEIAKGLDKPTIVWNNRLIAETAVRMSYKYTALPYSELSRCQRN